MKQKILLFLLLFAGIVKAQLFVCDYPTGVIANSGSQSSRTGTKAQHFTVESLLTPAESDTGKLVVTAEQADSAPHIYEDLVYPASVLTLDDERGWKFGGAGGGNTGGVRKVPAPEREGYALELTMTVDKESTNAPTWVFWHKSLDPELMTWDVDRVEVDVFPLDPIAFPIMAGFGTSAGVGASPATWSSLGTLQPGIWQTVVIPVNRTRPHIDALRFSVRINQTEVPHRQPVRILIDRMRFLPDPDPAASRFIDSLNTAAPLQAGYFQLTCGQDLEDDETLSFLMEVGTDAAFEGRIEMRGQAECGKKKVWSAPVNIEAPFTIIQGSILSLAQAFPADQFDFSVHIVNAKGEYVAHSSRPLPVGLYREADYVARRENIYARYTVLHAKWESLVRRGLIVNLPGSTLATAQWFLQPGGLLDNDYLEQMEYRIAHRGMDLIEELLDRTETEMADLESGHIQEPSVSRYHPDMPVYVKDGVFHQNEEPILMIGGIGWESRIEPVEGRITERLGFNAASTQMRMNDWLENNERAKMRRNMDLAFLNETRAAGLAANVLLSGHYPPNPLPAQYEGALDDGSGSSMLPWNLVAPQTLQIYHDFYDRVVPQLHGYSHVINIETANEPMHRVIEPAPLYPEAYREWVRQKYVDMDSANHVWGSYLKTFEEINLWDYFQLRKESTGAMRDWQLFLSDIETRLFTALKDRLLEMSSDFQVTCKLMGHHRHFGYFGLNEQRIVPEAQTLIGTDGHYPFWLDYLKTIKPESPVVNAEWHMLKGEGVVDDPALIQLRMFEGAAHGIGFGAIWNWRRKPWNTLVLGADEAMNRSPVTLDALGRGAWKLRVLSGPLGLFANQCGGRARLLFSNDSHLHQGEEYMHELEAVYWQLSRNASGVRYLLPAMLSDDHLQGVELVATGTAQYIETPAAALLLQWVESGGTLWLTAPGLTMDPYGHPHIGLPDSWVQAVSQPGSHSIGRGRIVVSADSPDLDPFMDGPWAVSADGNPEPEVKTRLVEDGKGGHWIYVMNRSDQERSIRLEGWPEQVFVFKAEDRWTGAVTDLSMPLTLAPFDIRIVHLLGE